MQSLWRALLVLSLLAGSLPALAQLPQFKVLVFSTPNKYHYEYIPMARESLEKMSRLHKFEMVWSKDPASFEGDLQQYGAIMMMNSAGDELNARQREAFERYMADGGNTMIVHRGLIIPAGEWPWYEKLAGRSFTIHPIMQTAVIHTLEPGFPATFSVPPRWIWTDEWYELSNPHNVTITPVMNVDESTYDPTWIWPGQTIKGMGKEHPVAWYHQVGKGRVFVTTLGHDPEAYRDELFLAHLLGGLYWTATGRGMQ